MQIHHPTPDLDSRVAEFADAYEAAFPGEQRPSGELLRAVIISVDAAPPMTDRQRRRIGPLLFGGQA